MNIFRKKSISNAPVPSELRLDPVSRDWVVIATGRAKRPEHFRKETRPELEDSITNCPFETLIGQERANKAFYKSKKVEKIPEDQSTLEWTTVAIPNKYPAFTLSNSLRERKVGPYQVMDGVGFHEVIITKDHTRDIPQFSQQETKELVDMYQECYLELMEGKFVHYISIFKNKGAGAGATIAHPHSQIIATAITDPDIQRSLDNSYEFFEKKKQCVHCVMLEWDRKEKSRIIYENDCFVSLCPFASRVAFEIRIYPVQHLAYFEKSDEHQKECLADILLITMQKLAKGLKDPDYNYFIHTAPTNVWTYDHYHWHFEILPKTATWAGFELGTGIEISTIEPEKAAEFLRLQ
ncbi:MAG: DUF4921 family protein [Candidatus Wildermuthbacteria bacterium]|nr:DUF4921 family protein [Candidatus Wildermuthbacteria bacterium]